MDVKHAVAFRLSALGDVVLTTGPLLHWHNTLGTMFTVVTRAPYVRVFESHPAVNQVIGLSADELRDWFATANRLARAYGGGTLVDLHRSTRSLLLAALWTGAYHKYPKLGLTRRLYHRLRLASAARRLLATNVPQRYALALAKKGTPPPLADEVRPRMFLRPAELDQARDFLTSRGLDTGKPVAALHPYATHPAKAWPAERWLSLVDALEADGVQTVAVGASTTPFLAQRLGQRDLTGTADIRGSSAILAVCSALVSGDSGPMHLGTAVGTPVVGLFGPTTPHWGFLPSGPKDTVLQADLDCRPCSLHGGKGCAKNVACLREVTVQDVIRALGAVL